MVSDPSPTIRFFQTTAACCLILLVHACATTVKKPVRPDDPLAGKILAARTGEILSYSRLMAQLKAHDVIYLSEKHDNPMHHVIQHRIIQHLVDEGLPPALGFEFFAVHDTPLLLSFVESGSHDHPEKVNAVIETDLRQQLNWDRQPDQMWQYYFDLLKLARNNSLTAAGLDLSGPLKRRITRKSLAGITPLEKKQIFSTGYDNPVYAQHMKTVFTSVHCGMGSADMQDRLYDTWTARNDTMARSITRLAQETTGPVVVIIGNGHTEYGLGVVDRVSFLDPALSQVNLALTEVRLEPADIADYIAPLDLKGFAPLPPADFIWLTRRVSYEDPCEAFKKSLQNMNSPEE
ncbi:MAG: ChaN family lipoprotein [Desulfotignum sp.]